MECDTTLLNQRSNFEVDQVRDNFGRIRANFGGARANFGQFPTNLGLRCGPILVDVGQVRAGFGRNRAKSRAKFDLSKANSGRNWASSVPHQCRLAHNWAIPVHTAPELDRIRPVSDVDQIRPGFGRPRAGIPRESARSGQNSGRNSKKLPVPRCGTLIELRSVSTPRWPINTPGLGCSISALQYVRSASQGASKSTRAGRC